MSQKTTRETAVDALQLARELEAAAVNVANARRFALNDHMAGTESATMQRAAAMIRALANPPVQEAANPPAREDVQAVLNAVDRHMVTIQTQTYPNGERVDADDAKRVAVDVAVDCRRLIKPLLTFPPKPEGAEAVACDRARVVGWWNCDCAGCRAYAKANTITTPAATQASDTGRGDAAKPVGTVTRVDHGNEVAEHRVELDPDFDEALNQYDPGTVISLYAAPAEDAARHLLERARSLLAHTPSEDSAGKDGESAESELADLRRRCEGAAKRWRVTDHTIGQGSAGNKARRRCADELRELLGAGERARRT